MSLFSSIELSNGWQFKQTDDPSSEGWLPVQRVPTVIHMDLLANSKIPNPSLDLNELEARWVAEKSWTYKCQFATPVMAPGNRATLVFEGLDTFAKVQLNGADILESDNMFIAHRVDITAKLHTSTLNSLEIRFNSALLRAREIRAEHPEHNYIAHQGELERIGVRKAQYHWGWDWGPRLMTAGPWKPIRLEVYNSRIDDVSIEYSLDESLRVCKGVITACHDCQHGDQIHVSLRSSDGEVVYSTLLTVGSERSMRGEFVLQIPSLWYPHGYGKQSQYLLEASVMIGDLKIHTVARKIGFRKAELIQEADSYGKSFYFRINGIDIFAGGSCWIPADNLLPRITRDYYRGLLEAMVEGNQVMTRIWGGGIYEQDDFYDLCDELGILDWQDFMFACGSYPTFPSYLESIETEARCNVRRLRHHPSLVMYAGGNENYYIQEKYGLAYNYTSDKDPQSWLKSTFPSRYIYEHLLAKVVAEESPSTVYHPDSPWGDGKDILDVTVGDIHQWEVWHGIMRPYQTYGDIGGRFNSEFGMEASAHLSTVKQYVTNSDEMYPQSLTMDFHNKADGHERRITSYLQENFKTSSSSLKYWIYLTQLLQSEALLYAYRSWRREWGSPSQRRCGGALVWQLNDCWPGTSWAIIDHLLVKKPAFYTIKQTLGSIAVGVQRTLEDWTKGHTIPPKKSKYDLWVVSSKAVNAESQKAIVQVRFISIRTGCDVLPKQKHELEMAPNATTVISEGMELDNPTWQEAYVIAATLIIGGQVSSRNVDWPQPFKYLSFKDDRGLIVKLAEARDKIEISARRPTKGLIFDERPGLDFSDNAIDVVPGEIYVVNVKGLEDGEELSYTFLGQDEGCVVNGI